MKHKKYLRKQVDGEDVDAGAMSDDKEDDDVPAAVNVKFIKKEDEAKDQTSGDAENLKIVLNNY